MIYVLEPEVFDYFPDDDAVDFALDVFPALLEHDVAFHVHVADAYWNDVGSLPEYLQGNLDVALGEVAVDAAGELVDGDSPRARSATGSSRAGRSCSATGRRSAPAPASTARS